MPKIWTKDEIIQILRSIKEMGWVKNRRIGNHGGVGNTLEDLMGITENNFAIANAGEWELKCHSAQSTSLLTLFHSEPSPRNARLVPQLLLPSYGWKHDSAGNKYPETEMSFRQTINAVTHSDRGFKVTIDETENRFLVEFNNLMVSDKHSEWLQTVSERVGLSGLDPQPYWGFSDIEHLAGTKLLNCFYLTAQRKKLGSDLFFNYDNIMLLSSFSFSSMLDQMKLGNIYIDFDARTGHNHGTKFRIKQASFKKLYGSITMID
jgi:hypothetical protein